MKKSDWVWIVLGSALLLTGGVALGGFSPTITKIGKAIATAEGFYVPGSRSNRNNNPGDLTVDVTGTGIGFDGPFVVYASVADGFDALYKQIGEWFSGTSKQISSDMTILQAAQIYSPDGSSNWANNVSDSLGVSVDTPLNQV